MGITKADMQQCLKICLKGEVCLFILTLSICVLATWPTFMKYRSWIESENIAFWYASFYIIVAYISKYFIVLL